MSNRLDSANNLIATFEAKSLSTQIRSEKQQLLSGLSESVEPNEVKAQVLAKLTDGSYQVQIGKIVANVILPGENQVGDIVNIRFNQAAIQEESGNNSATSGLTSGKYLTNTAVESKTVQPELPLYNTNTNTSNQQSSVTVLSNFSKLIDILLRPDNNIQNERTSTSKPILSDPVELQDTQKLSNLLHREISTSGVFYESHLVDWADGKKTIADLALEPQSRLPPLDNDYNGLKPGENSSYRELTQIIQQQFHTLESDSLRWQGELIAGQKIEFEIRRDNPQKKTNQTKDDNEGFWQSEVRFTLPSLGAIATKIQLSGDHLRLTIDTYEETTEKTLKMHASELATRMTAIGTILDSFTVKKHGNDK
ncbi:flagellar hook-length control protein FliK [Undibacterium sp. Ji67W]|uniref:flagellar hook-length control protein FliK n=1 Tax=Undibacterium sp. Ji67W TaxID=3413042 RepID=UPI003BF1861D